MAEIRGRFAFAYDVRDVFRDGGFDGGRFPLAKALVSVAKDKIEADKVLPEGYTVVVEDGEVSSHIALFNQNNFRVHFSDVLSEEYLNGLATYLHRRVILPAECLPVVHHF